MILLFLSFSLTWKKKGVIGKPSAQKLILLGLYTGESLALLMLSAAWCFSRVRHGAVLPVGDVPPAPKELCLPVSTARQLLAVSWLPAALGWFSQRERNWNKKRAIPVLVLPLNMQIVVFKERLDATLSAMVWLLRWCSVRGGIR